MKSLNTYLSENFTPSTMQRYLIAIERLLSYLGEEKAKHARYYDITDYLNVLRKSGYTPDFINCELHGLKNYYKWLIKIGERTDNPTKNIYLNDLRSRDIQFQNLFTEGELEILLDREERYALLKWRNKLAISFYIYQGLTTGEICDLTLHDINLDKGTVFIKASTRTNSRILPLRSNEVIFLERYLTFDRPFLIKEDTEKLLVGKLGKAENGEGVQYLIECNKLLFPGRNLNPKTIRQSVLVNLFQSGMDIKDVQLFAGHKYPSTTEKYKPADLRELKDAIGRFHPLGEII